MVVSNRAKSLALLLVSSFMFACETESAADVSDAEVIALARDKVATATAQLGEQIEKCEQEAEQGSIPPLDAAKIVELGIDQEDLLLALSYLSFRNGFNCEKEARLAMAYALGTLAATQEQLGQDAIESEEINKGLIYPPVEHLRYEASYSRLDSETKHYLENAVGEAPFDLFEALAKYQLIPE